MPQLVTETYQGYIMRGNCSKWSESALWLETSHIELTLKMDSRTSTVNANTREEIYKIRNLSRKFRLCCDQLVRLNNLVEDVEIRYNRSQVENRRSYRYILRLKLCSLEGVRNMFYDYAYAQADQLEKMQLDLYNRTGIAWNDSLAEESDLDEIEDMETSNTS